jgi:hypothetical protein
LKSLPLSTTAAPVLLTSVNGTEEDLGIQLLGMLRQCIHRNDVTIMTSDILSTLTLSQRNEWENAGIWFPKESAKKGLASYAIVYPSGQSTWWSFRMLFVCFGSCFAECIRM